MPLFRPRSHSSARTRRVLNVELLEDRLTPTTTTTLAGSPNPTIFGESVTFTATVSDNSGGSTPTGGVTYFDTLGDADPSNDVNLGFRTLDASGQAALTTNTLTVGTHTIRATYSDPDGNFGDSTGIATQTVAQGTTSTRLDSSLNPSFVGDLVTFTATVTANAPSTLTPTGSVTFVDTTTWTMLGSGNLDGAGKFEVTTSALAVGTHTIQATYIDPSGGYGGSSDTEDQTVNAAQTTTTITSSVNPSFPGQQVTFTATVAPAAAGSTVVPTGSVTFKIDGGGDTVVGLNAAGQASFSTSTLSLGQHTITADYVSDSANFSNSSGSATQAVSPVTTTTALGSSANPSFPSQAVTFTATVSHTVTGAGVPTGSVRFKIDGGGDTVVGLNAAGQASFSTSTLSLGQHTITADYTSNSIVFANSSAPPVTQNVNPVQTTTALGSSANPSFPGQVVTFTATVTSTVIGAPTPTGSVTFKIDGGGGTTVSLDGAGQAAFTTGTLSLGQHTVTADYTSDSVVFASSSAAPLTQNVNAFPTAISLMPPVGQGQTVAVIAIVTAPGGAVPTGTVTFFIDGVPAATSVLDTSGRTGFSAQLAPGARTISAVFVSNSPNFLNSGPVSVQQFARKDYFAAGTDAGVPALVQVYDAATGAAAGSLVPYVGFFGGVRVAVGDVDGDGFGDIITGTATGSAHVKVFSGRTFTEIRSFLAFGGFTGGVSVAAGDLDADGRAEIIVGAGAGAGPHVKVFGGATGGEVASFFAYGAGYLGGVSVGAGDVNHDGRADIITGTSAGFSHVKVFSGAGFGEIRSFLAFSAFSGGVNVAGGDLDGDGFSEITVGAATGVSHVKAFGGATGAEVRSFLVFGAAPIGVRVGAVDRNGDGRADILAGAAALVSHVRTFEGLTLADLDSFFAFGSLPLGGVFVGGQ